MSSFLRVLLARRRRFRYSGSRVPCNLCGGESFLVVGRRDRWLNPLINVMCRQCGLIFLDPMPTDEEINRYYERHYRIHYQGAAEPTPVSILRSLRNAEERLQMLASVLKSVMRILDVGSGGGEFLATAQRQGYEVEGVEPNVGYARYAERTYGVKVHVAPFMQIDFGGRQFDLITCNHVLEHMRNPLANLRRFHQLLVPGGNLHLLVPDMAEPHKTPIGLFHFGHLHGFTHETLVMMAAKGGFAPFDDTRRNTALLFRRLAGPDPNWFRFPEHATALAAFFRRRTMWRHIASIGAYKRTAGRLRYLLGDYLTVWRSSDRTSDATKAKSS